ncbi:hypothetical protein ACSBL2_23725 [Pedobacter sp. AW31-3R]|uniref:hypothetical protein n=1 Tax=Pedobacter sp. AW31-3R TaxID=3445781 RepID=UPI003FA12248
MEIKQKIEAIANTLLPSFIPKDKEQKELYFHFTLPPNSSYKVFFRKDAKGIWQFIGFEEAGQE